MVKEFQKHKFIELKETFKIIKHMGNVFIILKNIIIMVNITKEKNVGMVNMITNQNNMKECGKMMKKMEKVV